ncbi:hypothetical protein ZIOFF_002723 [Zingiber officinale]|uniref:GTP cyclohydrolase 1 n=1 Tax=Zingiber officinale TaxID=94328 RepID=A0A8J5I836_ZINOF|nr:hypothetical protein ZIOFF_002723 [Zingiber officinale]
MRTMSRLAQWKIDNVDCLRFNIFSYRDFDMVAIQHEISRLKAEKMSRLHDEEEIRTELIQKKNLERYSAELCAKKDAVVEAKSILIVPSARSVDPARAAPPLSRRSRSPPEGSDSDDQPLRFRRRRLQSEPDLGAGSAGRSSAGGDNHPSIGPVPRSPILPAPIPNPTTIADPPSTHAQERAASLSSKPVDTPSQVPGDMAGPSTTPPPSESRLGSVLMRPWVLPTLELSRVVAAEGGKMKTTRGKSDTKFYRSDEDDQIDLNISSRRRPEKWSPTLPTAAAAAKAAADEEEEEQIWGEEEEATDPLASEAKRALSIEEAVKALLQALGEDHEREDLQRTPHRMAEAFRGGTRDKECSASLCLICKELVACIGGALFPEAGLNPGVGHARGVGGLVVVRYINLFSYYESCLLPFSIKCHVGYVPSGGRVVGLSKLSRVADVFAKRFQDPKRLASEVCAALHNNINPAGVAVSLQYWHMKFSHLCDTNFTHSTISDMQSWGTVLASSRSGVFKEGKNSLWDDFTSLLILSGAIIEGGDTNHSQRQKMKFVVVRKEERLLISAEMAIYNPSATIQVTRPSQSSFSSSSENMTPLHVSAANVNGNGYDSDGSYFAPPCKLGGLDDLVRVDFCGVMFPNVGSLVSLESIDLKIRYSGMESRLIAVVHNINGVHGTGEAIKEQQNIGTRAG